MGHTIKPMTPAEVRRVMARAIDATTLNASERNERIALGAILHLVELGVLRTPEDNDGPTESENRLMWGDR